MGEGNTNGIYITYLPLASNIVLCVILPSCSGRIAFLKIFSNRIQQLSLCTACMFCCLGCRHPQALGKVKSHRLRVCPSLPQQGCHFFQKSSLMVFEIKTQFFESIQLYLNVIPRETQTCPEPLFFHFLGYQGDSFSNMIDHLKSGDNDDSGIFLRHFRDFHL